MTTAKLLPIVIVTLLATSFMKTSLAIGMAEGVENADLVLALSLGGLVWVLGHFMRNVHQRFDATDEALKANQYVLSEIKEILQRLPR